MKWSKEQPKKPGMYVHVATKRLNNYHSGEVGIITIEEDAGGLYLWIQSFPGKYAERALPDGDWLGPLPERR